MHLYRIFIIVFSFCLLFRTTNAQELSNDVDSVFIKFEIERLLLLYSDSGNIEIVRYLLDKGANPNVISDNGVTSLMFAAQNGSYEIVELLLNSNADPNIVPYDGNTALHAAVRAGNDSIAELLIKYNAKVNVTNTLGLTPLHNSVWYGFPYLTDILIYNNANVDTVDIYGFTPLMFSIYSGANISTQLLLENGANPNLTNNKGVSPLMIAAQFNDTLLTRLLLKYNANINLIDKNGVNALSYAISGNSIDVIKILLDNGAAKQSLSKSYYQQAAETEFKDVKYLIDSAGLKTKLKFSLGEIYIGSGTIFSNHEFLWGFNLGVTELVSKITANIGFWYRPNSSATLRFQDDGIFQYEEKRKILELRVNKLKNIKTFNSGNSVGLYFGGNLNITFRDFKGSDLDPKTKLYHGFNAGLFFGGQYTKLFTGWEFTGLKTPEATPHRVGVHLYLYFPTNKPRVKKITIYHVD